MPFSVGDMSDTPRIIPLIRRLAMSAIAALLALALTVALMTYLTWQSSQWVRHTRQVQFAGARALDLALDRQASIAAYLVANDSSSLAVELRARPAFQRELDTLTTLTIDNPQQQRQLELIDEAMRELGFHAPIRFCAATTRPSARASAGCSAPASPSSRVVRSRARRPARSRSSALHDARAKQHALALGRGRRRRHRGDRRAHRAARLRSERSGARRNSSNNRRSSKSRRSSSRRRRPNRRCSRPTWSRQSGAPETAVEAEEARDAARALEERYRILFDRNPAPMWVYAEETLRFLDVNQSAVHQYGYTAEEFLQMTLEDIRLPADVPLLRQRQRHTDSELRESPGWRHRRKDGTLIRVDIFTHGVEFEGRRARIVLAMDVTARDEAEAALNRAAGILRAVVDDSPLAIVIFSPRSRHQSLEQGGDAPVRNGPPRRRSASRFLEAHSGRRKRQEFSELRTRLVAGEVDHQLRNAAQAPQWDSCATFTCPSVHSATVRGELSGIVSIISDVTQRKRLEAQYRQAQKMEAVGAARRRRRARLQQPAHGHHQLQPDAARRHRGGLVGPRGRPGDQAGRGACGAADRQSSRSAGNRCFVSSAGTLRGRA